MYTFFLCGWVLVPYPDCVLCVPSGGYFIEASDVVLLTCVHVGGYLYLDCVFCVYLLVLGGVVHVLDYSFIFSLYQLYYYPFPCVIECGQYTHECT